MHRFDNVIPVVLGLPFAGPCRALLLPDQGFGLDGVSGRGC